jgi:hypothetical protein
MGISAVNGSLSLNQMVRKYYVRFRPRRCFKPIYRSMPQELLSFSFWQHVLVAVLFDIVLKFAITKVRNKL